MASRAKFAAASAASLLAKVWIASKSEQSVQQLQHTRESIFALLLIPSNPFGEKD